MENNWQTEKSYKSILLNKQDEQVKSGQSCTCLDSYTTNSPPDPFPMKTNKNTYLSKCETSMIMLKAKKITDKHKNGHECFLKIISWPKKTFFFKHLLNMTNGMPESENIRTDLNNHTRAHTHTHARTRTCKLTHSTSSTCAPWNLNEANYKCTTR